MEPSGKPHSAPRRSREAAHAELPALADRLRQKSKKVTTARQSVLGALRQECHPLSIKEIFRKLTPGDCDLATVYRCMHTLEGLGMVKRFDLGDGVARFELLREGDNGHHHHLICTGCAEVVELDECLVGEIESEIASRSGFASITHRLEFFGVCPECRSASAPRSRS